VSDFSEENCIPIEYGIKSIPIGQLEECIAAAIAKAVDGSKLNCHITKLEVSDVHGVKIKLQLSNDSEDIS